MIGVWKFFPRAATEGQDASVRCVRAPSCYLARQWGRSHFHTDELECETLPADEDADVELRYTGNDFNHGGSPRGLKVIVRVGEGEWEDFLG